MVSMLEPSFRFSFAKIAFYTMRVKHKRLRRDWTGWTACPSTVCGRCCWKTICPIIFNGIEVLRDETLWGPTQKPFADGHCGKCPAFDGRCLHTLLFVSIDGWGDCWDQGADDRSACVRRSAWKRRWESMRLDGTNVQLQLEKKVLMTHKKAIMK